ncbi:MAG: hypothetical protein PHT60_01570 [Acidiphilium sp.]|nr:hypothetical protein [Acidiphilium sp.]MDD4934444.1 hypothetical protein [Acidiphilium sp.]
MSDISVIITSFLTAGVEWVEAFTIVLAVALAIGWPRAVLAAFAALAVLALMTLFGAHAVSAIGSMRVAQFIIAVFLLLFGLRWLAKAIARGAGLKRLHDETAAFAALSHSTALAETHGAMVVGFQGVLIEGLEVWLIVVALGAQTGHTDIAALSAIAALAVVAGAGLALRAPLSRVPENTVKFLVGCAILGFGTFWLLTSLGYDWPIGDSALPALMAFYALGGVAAIGALKASPQ